MNRHEEDKRRRKMNDADRENSTEDTDSGESPADKRLDEQLRRLYEYVLDEPIPKRLLDALKKGSGDEGSSEDENDRS